MDTVRRYNTECAVRASSPGGEFSDSSEAGTPVQEGKVGVRVSQP